MAVFIPLNQNDLNDILTAYDLGAVISFNDIVEGTANSNFLLETSAGKFILTLYNAAEASSRNIGFFMEVLNTLSSTGFLCPRPIQTTTGNSYTDFNGHAVSIVSFLDGKSLTENITPDHCFQLGKKIAQMHSALQSTACPFEARDFDLNKITTDFNALPDVNVFQDGLQSLIQQEIDFLQDNWPRDLPAGIIHADLFVDNVFFENDHFAGFIDFTQACNDFLAYDLAACLPSWCFNHENAFQPERAAALLKGYEAQRPLTDQERNALPILIRGGLLRWLVFRLGRKQATGENALINTKDPLELLEQIRFFQRTSPDFSSSSH